MPIPTKTALGSVLLLACAFNAPARPAGGRPAAAAALTANAPRVNQSQFQEPVNSARSSPAPLLNDEWESAVLFPARPSVLLADLDKGQGFLSTHGATPFPLTQRRLETGELPLELHLGHEVVRLRAIEAGSGLRGTAVVNNTDGVVMAEGYVNGRDPALEKIETELARRTRTSNALHVTRR